ncbi:MAG: hypothetical protein AMS26_13725 [Bacteroides sp. SM23_62]|nr:MAG: hypothetical protein AMS26_13725 [Bacteroides sp. SM23_62]
MPDKPDILSQFWQELRRRKVIRVITVYAAAAFVILELVDILAPSLRLPDWTLNLVLVLLCVGFIIAIILSWIYDIHPEEGIVKTEPAHKVKTADIPKTSNSWKIASYISFVVIVALIVLNIIPRTNLSKKRSILDKSIAVIPFIDDSPNKDNEHIINGIMDDLLINLQSIKDLRIPGRTSTEQYRNNPKPIPEIAAEMNVAYIVEGSGQRYGNKIRLRVQLVEGATDKHIWADSYDEVINGPEDIFRIQGQIAKSIAAELQAVITPEEKQLIEKVPTTSLTAHDFYQRGRDEQSKYWLDNDNKNALERAEDFYYKALEYDSTFAQAYTGLAIVYWFKHFSETFYTENFLDSALILADIALSFDNQLSEAYVIRGAYYWEHNEKEQALKEYNKAIRFNPNDWQAYNYKAYLYYADDQVKMIDNLHKAISLHRGPFLPGLYRDLSNLLAFAGFIDKAKYYQIEALKLDDDSASYYRYLADFEFYIGNTVKSIEFGKKSYAIDSTSVRVIYMLGLSHIWLGRYEEGLEYYKKFSNIYDGYDYPPVLYEIGYAYWVIGFKDEAEYYFNTALELWDQLFELGRILTGEDLFMYYQLAAEYAFQGDKDKAYEYFDLLNQLPWMPNWIITETKTDPMLDGIRDEPEFKQIVRDLEDKYQENHERVRKWLEENDML